MIKMLDNDVEWKDFFYTLITMFSSMPHRLLDFVEGACLLGVMISLGISHQEGNLNVLRSAGFSPFKIISISSLGALLLVVPLIVLDDLALRKTYLDAQINKNILLLCSEYWPYNKHYFRSVNRRLNLMHRIVSYRNCQ